MDNSEFQNVKTGAKRLADAHKSLNEIEQQLKTITTNSDIITQTIAEIKKERHATKTKNGLIKLGIGALFLVSSFLITCINYHSNQPITLVMYGLTSIGAVLLVWGLYDVIG